MADDKEEEKGLIDHEESTSDDGHETGSKPKKKSFARTFLKFLYLPWPVYFIVWNEFCERFSYYGMRAVLALFLKTFIGLDDDSSTAVYHAFIVLCYLTPVLGAIISDSCLGKYGTIVSLSIVYAVGNVIMSVSAIPFNESRGANLAIAGAALFIIALGTGGIKPCVSAFGGDQFKRTHLDLLPVFFSIFYFSINAGSLISTILTPILRNYVSCFGSDECFPLAFGVPAVLMVVSIVVFLSGTRWYIINKPKRSASLLFFRVPAAVVYALYRRLVYGKMENARNFMDYAAPTFDEKFVYDVWLFCRVLVMFLPLPIFWALFDQQGSRWTLQALRMDGQISGSIVIQPDQIQALNPIFIILLIPFFESIVYPLFARCKLLTRPLQRMVLGMAIAGLAFVMAALVEVYIQSQSTDLTAGQSKAVVTNTFSSKVSFTFEFQEEAESMVNPEPPFVLNGLETNTSIFEELGQWSLTATDADNDSLTVTRSLAFDDKHVVQVLLVFDPVAEQLEFVTNDTVEFYPEGDKSSVNVFAASVSGTVNLTLCNNDCSTEDDVVFATGPLGNLETSNGTNISISTYDYQLKSQNGSVLLHGTLPPFGPGGIYTVIIVDNAEEGYNVSVAQLNNPNSVNVFLQLPMYLTITIGEVLFSITGLEFAYSQAPVSMKSLCQAAWLLTVAFGNMVVVIVAESRIFANLVYEFIFFAACIEVLGIVFAIMAYFYKYVDPAKLLASHQGDLSREGSDDRENSLLLRGSPAAEKKAPVVPPSGKEPDDFLTDEDYPESDM